MAKSNYCQLYLTCTNTVEAAKITQSLLEQHLVVCVKQTPVESAYWWQDKIEHDNEIMLVMESRLDLFDEVEAEVAKLHSYQVFILEAMPIERVSKKAETWLKENVKNG